MSKHTIPLPNNPKRHQEMDGRPQHLRGLWYSAESKRKELDNAYDSNSSSFQENLLSAITTYEECVRVADQVSLFSPNEALEDISSGDIQYMVISYHLAELIQRLNSSDRKANLDRARLQYEKFLKLLDSYDILSKADVRLFEQYTENRNRFSTASTTDAAARRETKISRFRTEKELKQQLEVRPSNASRLCEY